MAGNMKKKAARVEEKREKRPYNVLLEGASFLANWENCQGFGLQALAG